MAKSASRPPKVRAQVWKCEEMHKVIREAIQAHVKDATAASRLEQVLHGFYAYAPASKLMIVDGPAATRKKS
jgi:hypothetical protein